MSTFTTRPVFELADRALDMVAELDGLPKQLVSRLSFSGKLQDFDNWEGVVRRSLKPRVSPWTLAVAFGHWDPRTVLSQAAKPDEDLLKEIQQAYMVKLAFAAWLLPLIDRSTSEGATLFKLINKRDDLCDDGVLLLRYIANRGLAKSKNEVDAIESEIAKLSFQVGGDIVAHEKAATDLESLIGRIDPSVRGGPHQHQERMLRMMPDQCKTQRIQIETQIEMMTQMGGPGMYPSPSVLLKMISPIVQAAKVVAQTNVNQSGLRSGKEIKCLNCGGAHTARNCTKKCDKCGLSFCGNLRPGGFCPCAKEQMPPNSDVLNFVKEPIPASLYARVAKKHASMHVTDASKGKASGGVLAPAPGADEASTQVTEAAVADFFGRFAGGPLSTEAVFLVQDATSGHARVFDVCSPTEMPCVEYEEHVSGRAGIASEVWSRAQDGRIGSPDACMHAVKNMHAGTHATQGYAACEQCAIAEFLDTPERVAHEMLDCEAEATAYERQVASGDGVRAQTGVHACMHAGLGAVMMTQVTAGAEAAQGDATPTAGTATSGAVCMLNKISQGMPTAPVMGLCDTATNAHVIRADSPLIAGQDVGPVQERGYIQGANKDAPSSVLGEIPELCVQFRTLAGKAIPLKLHKVLVSTTSPYDVLDVQAIFESDGWRFRLEDIYACSTPGGETVPIHRNDAGLPVVAMFGTSMHAQCYAVVAGRANKVLLQAARLGSPSREQLRGFVKNHALACVSMEDLKGPAVRLLDYCALRKMALMRNKSYYDQPAEAIADQPGKVVVFDYWGPFPHPAIATNGIRGLFGGADEHSDHFSVGLARHKRTEDWLNFYRLTAALYKKYGHAVECVLTDKDHALIQYNTGGDGLDFSTWEKALLAEGVLPTFSLEYQPQPHGRVEVAWEHGQAGARILMQRCALNDDFFLWAMRCFLMLRNAFPRKGGDKSRHMLLTGAPYPAQDDRVFGAPGHFWVPPEKRPHKGAPTSLPCICVGKGQVGWRVIYGTGAAAQWIDVTVATFYETGLVTKGIMPKLMLGASVEVQTEITGDVRGTTQKAAREAVKSSAAGIRADPAAWVGSLRPRNPANMMIAQALVREAETLTHAVISRDAARVRLAGALVMHGAAYAMEAHAHMCAATAGMQVQECSAADCMAVQSKSKPGTVRDTFTGPQGQYSLIRPQSYNEAMRTPQAPEWWQAVFEKVSALEAKGILVPVSPDDPRIPPDAQILPSVLAFSHEKDKTDGSLKKRKVRPAINGSKQIAEQVYSAPAPIPEVLASIAVCVVKRRYAAGADLGDAYTEASRPEGKVTVMRMFQGFQRYDGKNQKMLYLVPRNYWGERTGGRVFEDHKHVQMCELGLGKLKDAVNVYTMSANAAGDMLASTNVVDDFFIQADQEAVLDEYLAKLDTKFSKVKKCKYPTAFDGLKLTWVLGEDGRPLSCTVSVPEKIMALVGLLGGIEELRGRVKGKRITHDLLTAAMVVADSMTELGERTRRGTGVVVWIGPVRVDTKLFAHVLTRVMIAPPPEAAMLLDLVAVALYDTMEDGLTYVAAEAVGATEQAELGLRGATRILSPYFKMADGAPLYPTQAYDSTWAEPKKCIASTVYTYGGAAVLAAVTAIPGPMMSSAQAELTAQAWALALGVYMTYVITGLGGEVPRQVPLLGDNVTAVDIAASEASVANLRFFLRRLGFAQELCDPQEGEFKSVHAPTEENPVDFMGKLVTAEKIARSLRWAMGSHRRPPLRTLQDATSSVPV